MTKPSKLSNLIENYNKAKSSFLKEGQQALKEFFHDFLSDTPEVEKIVWTQYTPYFNDGEPCVFCINKFELKPNWELLSLRDKQSLLEGSYTESYEEYDSYHYGEASLLRILYQDKSCFSDENKNKLRYFSDEFNKIPKDIFLDMFGDHCQVTVNRDGITVEEFDHD